MEVAVSVDIDAPTQPVWDVISDIENCMDTISAINALEIIEPAKGPSIMGLKWKETRTMFGKEASETMWITDLDEGRFYEARAESHGSVYLSRMTVEPKGDGSRLTMSFNGQPQTFGAKVMWALTGFMAKGAMRKACLQDLEEIKKKVEAR